ncbi:MAG: protein adenylyltransferase SelO family protein, partial [bacterium]|nr:protein adenylyltransferase SelO family protein [bacterium]
GSFEYAAAQNDLSLLKKLVHYAMERHAPTLLNQEQPYLEFFKTIVDHQASLIAQWMSVGFIHGVMNTDNMTVSGETIDYGPCAFIDEFDLNAVFSSIDINGRYAFGNQASIAQWNLSRLGQALLPLFNDPHAVEQLNEIIDSFTNTFHYYWDKKIRAKLGLIENHESSLDLIKRLFSLLQQHQADFTNTFRLLSQAIDSEHHEKLLQKNLGNQAESKQWIADWRWNVTNQNIHIDELKGSMDKVNPCYIPRNHLVNRAIKDFIERKDRKLLDKLLFVLKNPYQQQDNTAELQSPPLADERVTQTFCGT